MLENNHGEPFYSLHVFCDCSTRIFSLISFISCALKPASFLSWPFYTTLWSLKVQISTLERPALDLFFLFLFLNSIFTADTITGVPPSPSPPHPCSPIPLAVTTLLVVFVHGSCTRSLANPFTFFHPVPPSLLPSNSG